MHQLRCIALVLVRVVEASPTHDELRTAIDELKLQLLVPVPILHNTHLVVDECVDCIYVVDEVQDEGLQFELDKEVTSRLPIKDRKRLE